MSGPSFIDCFQPNAFQIGAFQTGFTLDVGGTIVGGQFSRGRWRKLVDSVEAERKAARDAVEAAAKAKREAAAAKAKLERAMKWAEKYLQRRQEAEAARQAQVQQFISHALQAHAGAANLTHELAHLSEARERQRLALEAAHRAAHDDDEAAFLLILQH
jgi:hypothetical protein